MIFVSVGGPAVCEHGCMCAALQAQRTLHNQCNKGHDTSSYFSWEIPLYSQSLDLEKSEFPLENQQRV